jgi:hypothetical protein
MSFSVHNENVISPIFYEKESNLKSVTNTYSDNSQFTFSISNAIDSYLSFQRLIKMFQMLEVFFNLFPEH